MTYDCEELLSRLIIDYDFKVVVDSKSRGISSILISTNQGNVHYADLNQICRQRAETIFFNEPETIQWLRQLQPKDCLFDIGANIGLFSMWAAVINKCQVVALEPDPENVRALGINSFLNSVDEKVTVFPFGASNVAGITDLFLSQRFSPGGSLNSVKYNLTHQLSEADQLKHRIKIYSVTVDEIARHMEPSQRYFLKVDVDGLELNVLEGGLQTLSDQKCVSALVELDDSLIAHQKAISLMKHCGFQYDPLQVRNCKNWVSKYWPEFTNLANYIFFKA
jgi:FkbM family methyltransferase